MNSDTNRDLNSDLNLDFNMNLKPNLELGHVKFVFFLGIGGIGMSSLARYFKQKGLWVGGYDRIQSDLCRQMESEGMKIFFEDRVELIPDFFIKPSEGSLIVFTPSIPAHNKVKKYFESAGFPLWKRSVVLGKICENYRVIAVAGTHGKTTTCSMITHLLKTGGLDITSFLGGISTNYQTNFILGKSGIAVVEADEYDRSFLTLYPECAVITSMDADHLDIYGNLENMIVAYNQFASQVIINGELITKAGLPIKRKHLEYKIKDSYLKESVNPTKNSFILKSNLQKTVEPDIWAENIHLEDGSFEFDYSENENPLPGNHLLRNHLFIPGRHNIENAVAAIRVSLQLGIMPDKIQEGLASFLGVKRRFEYIIKSECLIYIDDYAHHQDELRAFLTTVRELYPKRRITAIFQPHLFSRTRDFYLEMAESLSIADELYLMDVYPAREEPMDGISSKLILDNSYQKEKFILSGSEILERLKNGYSEVILTIGAGDIDRLVMPIKKILEVKSDPKIYFSTKGGEKSI